MRLLRVFFPLAVVSSGLAFGLACSSSNGPAGASGDASPATTSTHTNPPPQDAGPDATLGDVHQGTYNLGPVDWAETQFHNSCAPYPASIQSAYGDYLAGVGLDFNGGGQLCDACILLTTRLGKSVIARVVTTGETKAPGDVDLSPQAYDLIHQDDPQGTPDNPRPMQWQVVKCPADASTDKIEYQFQTGANVWWTSLWVRSVRLPVAKVEVQSANHPSFTELIRGTDGTYTDGGGFGSGAFTLRITSMDGQTVTDTFPSFDPGGLLVSTGDFQ